MSNWREELAKTEEKIKLQRESISPWGMAFIHISQRDIIWHLTVNEYLKERTELEILYDKQQIREKQLQKKIQNLIEIVKALKKEKTSIKRKLRTIEKRHETA